MKTPGRWAKLRTLSGGNQQKLLLARELAGQPRRSSRFIPPAASTSAPRKRFHEALREQRASAALLISEDLDELLALSDRIAVLFDGRVMGMSARGANLEEIGLLMAGVGGQESTVASRDPRLPTSPAATIFRLPTPHRAVPAASRWMTALVMVLSFLLALLRGDRPLPGWGESASGLRGNVLGRLRRLERSRGNSGQDHSPPPRRTRSRRRFSHAALEHRRRGAALLGAIFATGLALFVIPGAPGW